MGNKLVYVLLQLGRGCDVEEEVALGVALHMYLANYFFPISKFKLPFLL